MTDGGRAVQRRWMLRLLPWGAFGVLALAAACGSKAPPRPPATPTVAAVQDLSARIVGDTLELAWTAPDGGADVLRYTVWRWQRRVSAECPACPADFAPVGFLAAAGAMPDTLRLVFELEPGWRTTWRVVPETAAGAVGAPSNEVTIDF